MGRPPLSEPLAPCGEGHLQEDSGAIPGIDVSDPIPSLLPSAYHSSLESLTIIDLSKISISETQEAYMASTGHIVLPTEEDASYVTFDHDDLVVISGSDDNLPVLDNDDPSALHDLL